MNTKYERFIIFEWADSDAQFPYCGIEGTFKDIENAIDCYKQTCANSCAAIFDCDERRFIFKREPLKNVG